MLYDKKIEELKDCKAIELLIDFMRIYLANGFGVMNKTDIETLMYHIFKKYNLVSGKCFDDSFVLQIPEAKARKLIYESQIKYSGFDKDNLDRYLRKSVGEILTHAFLSKNGKEIRFAIEDKYLRVALNAKLRSNNYFADTSFNKDIISLDENAFTEMILQIAPNFQKDEILEKLTAIEIEESVKNKELKDFMKDVVKKIMTTMSVNGLQQLGAYIISLV